jgi:DNA polymerase-3 subunit gamma/tau
VDKIVKQSQRFNLAEILYIFNMLNSAQDLMRKSGLPRIQLEILLVKLTNRDLTRGAAGGKAILDTAGVAVTRSPERPRAVSEKTPKDTGFSGFKPDTDIKYADTGVGTFVQEAPLAEDNVSIAVQERLVSNSDIPAKDIISGSVNIDEIRNLWPELLSRIKSEKISAALFLLEGKPDFMDGFTLNINFPEQFVFYKEALERTENRNIIEKYLKEIFNKELKIKLNIVDTAPETIDKHVSSQPDVDAAVTHTDSKKEIISNNSHKNIDNVNKDNAMPEPIVKAALDIFKGRVVRK